MGRYKTHVLCVRVFTFFIIKNNKIIVIVIIIIIIKLNINNFDNFNVNRFYLLYI